MNLEELRARLGPPTPPVGLVSDAPSEHIPLHDVLGGSTFEGPAGPYFAVDSSRGNAHVHGRYSFRQLVSQGSVRIPVVNGDLQAIETDLESVAFIDTETTGLGYGVGTQVFMIGIGHVRGDAFHVRQFFLRHPSEEHSVLSAISDYLGKFSTLISYNGRSFDWPLLENRFIYQRLWSNPLQPAHIDLLYTARRLWKRRMESCGLGSIESSVLRVRRTSDDVEGWMIPQLYFRYIRTGDVRPLRRVFYHNLHDVFSLAMLTIHVHDMIQDPWGGSVDDIFDFVSLSRIFDLIGEKEVAVRCLTHALASGLPPGIETEAWLRLALINKRAAKWDEAVPLFENVLSRRGFERIACVELAKYHEHIARDPGRAMAYTVRAMRSSDLDFTRWPGTRRLELHHRHGRLRRKIAALS